MNTPDLQETAALAPLPRYAPSFFDNLPDRVYPRRIPGGIIFGWVRNGVGFGQLTLRVTRGKLEVDAECMGPDFCAEVIKQAISEALPNDQSEPRGL